MLIDANAEIAELSREFVCLKFCETDDGPEYYKAAGYFLPQWYWQPIMVFTTPDLREINVHWRHTHEAVDPAVVARIMKDALASAGRGFAAEEARAHRMTLGRAESALAEGEFDEARALAESVAKAVQKGWLSSDADKIAREADFLKGLRPMLDKLEALPEYSADIQALLNAANLALARGYAEALAIISESIAAAAPSGESAEFAKKLLEVISDSVEVSRAFQGKYRFGPDIYHDMRAEIRVRLDSLDKLTLQYHVLSKDGRVYKAFEEHGPVRAGNHLRSSTLIPFLDIVPETGIVDVRIEAQVAGRIVSFRHSNPGSGPDRWWEKKDVRALLLDTHRGSTWNGPEFPKTGVNGVDASREVAVSAAGAEPDPVLAELRSIYEVLDNMRFSREAAAATFRITALGTKCVKYVAPLADRFGAVTTTQIIPALARIPHKDAAAALFHVLGADDGTIRYHVPSELGWIECQDYLDVGELVSYLSSADGRLAKLAVTAIGLAGHKDGFLPVFGYLKDRNPGSDGAAAALTALARIAGRDFGLSPEKPLSSQPDAVLKLHSWWKSGASDAPRAVWHAQALEDRGIVQAGSLAPAVAAADAGKTAAILSKILDLDDDRAVRSALVIAKDLRIAQLGDQILGLYRKIDARSPNLNLARNALRDLMTPDLAAALTMLISDPSKSGSVIDLLLVATGKFDFYPTSGRRFGPEQMETERQKWAGWIAENKGNLVWNPVERRLEVKD